MYGSILLGGTKIECAIGESSTIAASTSFPTTTPAASIAAIVAFFSSQPSRVTAIGVGSFGPLLLREGRIGPTPKPGWAGTALTEPLEQALDVPVVLDTDVNVEGLGEHAFGAAQGLNTFVYLTVGTGIGGGGMVEGNIMHGLAHPEMGHIRIPHDRARDPFEGICPYHKDCLEGLASGPAMAARWGMPGKELLPTHEGWDLEIEYLAQALTTYALVLCPERIIVGGGVALTSPEVHLFERLRVRVQELLANYIQHPAVLEHIDSYIVPPTCEHPGLLGGFELARRATGK